MNKQENQQQEKNADVNLHNEKGEERVEYNRHDGTVKRVEYSDGTLTMTVDLPTGYGACDIIAFDVSAYIKNDYENRCGDEMDLATIIFDFKKFEDPDAIPDDEIKQLTNTGRADYDDIREQMKDGRAFFSNPGKLWAPSRICSPNRSH